MAKKENKTKETFKKAWEDAKVILKDAAKGAGKIRNNYLEDDKKQGGGLGLFR